jgi:WD40 repeat protein
MDYAVTADGESVLTTSGDHVRMWHAGASSPAWTVEPKERIVTLALSDDGARAAWAALDGGVVTLADARTGEAVAEAKPAGTLGVAHLAFAPGGRVLITAGPRGVDLFDAATGASRGKLRADPQHSELTLSPAGDRLATRRGDAQIDLWDLATGARLAGFSGQEANIEDLVFSPDGKTLVSGSYDRTALVLDATATDLLHYWPAGKERARAMAVSANATRVALSSDGDELRVLDVNAAGLVPTPMLEAEGERGAKRVRLSPDGKRLLLARGSLVVLASATDSVGTGYAELGVPVTEIDWSRDGARAAVGLEDGSVVMLDAVLAKVATVPSEGKKAPILLALSPRADLVAIASLDRTVRVARTSDGAVVFGPEPTTGIPSALAFSDDGASFAISDQEKVRWLDTRSWTGRVLKDHEQAVLAIAFSPNGRTLASASADQTVALNFADGVPVVKLTGHTGAVVDVAFSPAGDRVLTASEDGTARVWDPTLAAAFDVIDPFGGRVDGARFLDANRIALFGTGGAGAAVAVVRSAPVDRKKDLAATGALTNLRVCRSSFTVVPIAPAPEDASVWAPDDACRTSAPAPGKKAAP